MRVVPAALLAALALAGCAMPGDPGRGMAERGIGGTGGPARIAERGIGGTGISNGGETGPSGDTGIVGTITGFGSVFVNGLEIASDGLADVDVDGVSRPVGTLKVGQFARVVAWVDAEHLHARAVKVEHEVSGPVERVLPDGVLVVAGQHVQIRPRTIGGVPAAGEWVEVSGLRTPSGDILASRIDHREAGDILVSGLLLSSPHGSFHIGQLAVLLPAGADTTLRRVTVSGRLKNRALVVRALQTTPFVPSRPGLIHLVVQAFVQAREGGLRFGDTGAAAIGPRLGAVPADTPVVMDLVQDAAGGLVATGLRAEGQQGAANGATSPAAAAAHGALANGVATSAAAGKGGAGAQAAGAVSAATGSSHAADSAGLGSAGLGAPGLGLSGPGGISVGAGAGGAAPSSGAASGGAGGASAHGGSSGNGGVGGGGPGGGGTGGNGTGGAGGPGVRH